MSSWGSFDEHGVYLVGDLGGVDCGGQVPKVLKVLDG